MDSRTIVRPVTLGDLEGLQRIYNHEILHGVATWDLVPWTDLERRAWIEEHSADPMLSTVVADLAGEVAGFAYFSTYRGKVGYRYTRETSVYIDPAYHRQGIGRALMESQIETARHLGLHALMAVIEASNVGSIALHAALGFERVAHKREVGRKFGRWLDSVEMELMLPVTPPD